MRPPFSPPLPAADSTLTLVAPIGGAAIIVVNGKCVLSKEHGVPSINVHAALGLSSTPPQLSDGDAVLDLSGSYPSLVFEDEGAEISSSLVKPQGKLELHALGGIGCASHPVHLTNRTIGLELSVRGQAIIVFSNYSNGAIEESVALALSADGSDITLHGGTLVADGLSLQPLQCEHSTLIQ